MSATYRTLNDRSLNSSTYHKKDGTAIRAILKQELVLHSTNCHLGDNWKDCPACVQHKKESE
jgi:predicted HAD superfamily hydrolase